MSKLSAATFTAMLSVLMLQAANAASPVLMEYDYDPLYYDWRLSAVMGGPVYTAAMTRVGAVNDVIIGPTGLIDSVIVQTKSDNRRQYFEVKWRNVDFDPMAGSVTLLETEDDVKKMPKKAEPAFADTREWEASDILGMTVHTEEEEKYGEVIDLLFDAGSDDLTAYVIERRGAGAVLFAVEWDPALIDMDAEIIALPYTVEDLADVEVFVFTL